MRKEQRGLEGIKSDAADAKVGFNLEDYLKPRGLEIINGKIKKIAEETTRGMNDPMAKARAIYTIMVQNDVFPRRRCTVCPPFCCETAKAVSPKRGLAAPAYGFSFPVYCLGKSQPHPGAVSHGDPFASGFGRISFRLLSLLGGILH